MFRSGVALLMIEATTLGYQIASAMVLLQSRGVKLISGPQKCLIAPFFFLKTLKIVELRTLLLTQKVGWRRPGRR